MIDNKVQEKIEENSRLYSVIDSEQKFSKMNFEKASVQSNNLEGLLEKIKKDPNDPEVLNNAGLILMGDKQYFYNHNNPAQYARNVLEGAAEDTNSAFDKYIKKNSKEVFNILDVNSKLVTLLQSDLKPTKIDKKDKNEKMKNEKWNYFVGMLNQSKITKEAYESEDVNAKIEYLSQIMFGDKNNSWRERLISFPGVDEKILNRLIADYVNITGGLAQKEIQKDGKLNEKIIDDYSKRILNEATESKDEKYFKILGDVSKKYAITKYMEKIQKAA